MIKRSLTTLWVESDISLRLVCCSFSVN